ncbi:hypothetical protein TWF788_007994 [Orbilia oligospora]|uniref:RNase III domain-containing protein n=1 Tax=Orbilia oligospora TaxID=2813651 RepID=A0A7C8PPP6_ORBOL|nr:hypothetical protein TWF788_007994 [Orbilia oligospora]
MVDQTKVENIIGYKFSNSDLLAEALEACGRAYTHDTKGGTDGNKRLALVGDALLTLIQFDEWYPSSDSRETANNARKKYTSNVNLEKCAERFGIKSEILLDDTNISQGKVPRTASASAIEALLAAVWFDSNKDLERVRQVALILEIVEEYD